MNKNRIYTYCIEKEDGKNMVSLLESKELQEWKTEYKKDIVENAQDIKRLYCDPDTSYIEGKNHQFFHQLVLFLEKMEKEMSNELQGTFHYEFVENEGIKVWGTDKDGNEISEFYLRSDQLGFSAPSNMKSHPYDLYIMKSDDKNNAIDKVTEWITTSRTIGGSFLWPTPFYFDYNPARGGKITSDRSHYIQDRVDLTLWELKYWYEKTDKNTIINVVNKDHNSNLDIWLEHFTNFKTYIRFFHFEEFVMKQDEEIIPINILNGGITCEPKWGENGENPEIEISRKLDINAVEKMLIFVNYCIIQRTETITDLLEQLGKIPLVVDANTKEDEH